MNILPVRPQWAPAAIGEVERLLSKEKVVFEWGTGMSTPWLAERVRHVFSMDNDYNWKRFARRICRDRAIKNVDLMCYDRTEDARYFLMIYYISEMVPIDIAIVDGVQRLNCFDEAITRVKRGGLIILDDSEWAEHAPAFKRPGISLLSEYGSQQRTAIFKKL